MKFHFQYHSNFSIHPSQSKSFASESRRRSGTPNDAIDSGSLASENWKPAAAKASSMDSNTLNVGEWPIRDVNRVEWTQEIFFK